MNLRKIIFVLIVAFVLFGCISSNEAKQNQEQVIVNKTEEVKEIIPSFTIFSPMNGERVDVGEANEVTVQLKTKNLIITREIENKNGEGHFIRYLDGIKIGEMYSKNYVLNDLKKGEHVIEIELVHNDGSSYSPKIMQTMSFIANGGLRSEEPETYLVEIRDYEYLPNEVTVVIGDTVVWTNKAQYPRSATDGTTAFNTGTIAIGKTGSVIFRKVGTYEYYSANYPNMKGKVIVENKEG